MYDLIIIGAGPAGLTAGIYACRANLKTLIIEKESIGGQISSSPLVENYPGYENISGSELSDNMFNQVMNLGVDFEADEVVEIIDGEVKTVATKSNKYQAKAVIIATGATHRKLNLENENKYIGNGVHFCATCDGAFYKGKDVCVVGGANTAVQSAIYLAGICNKVYIVYRGSKLRCEDKLLNDLEKLDNVEVIYNANISRYIGEDKLEAVELNILSGTKTINVEGVFISIGVIPNNNLVESLLELDESGYIKTDDCLTTKKGIFVAGDVREKKIRQLTTAVNDGTIAAMNAIDYIKLNK